MEKCACDGSQRRPKNKHVLFYLVSMKGPLCPLTWAKAQLNSIQKGSNHKTESEPTRAGSFWKMWIPQSWRGNTNNLQLPDLEKKKKKKEAFPLCVPPSKTEPDLKLKLHSKQHQSCCKPITGLHTPTECRGLRAHLPARYLSIEGEELWFQL